MWVPTNLSVVVCQFGLTSQLNVSVLQLYELEWKKITQTHNAWLSKKIISLDSSKVLTHTDNTSSVGHFL